MTMITDPCLKQGSYEWKELRKTKVTASDAAIIMGLNPWKDTMQLYEEKLGLKPEEERNAAMQRGIDMEEQAREAFEKMTGVSVFPRVVIKDWQMASLDGIDLDDTCQVEIKCGGKKLHEMAKRNVVPAYYRAQVMHQLFLTGLKFSYYFSFDGKEGIIIPVERDNAFIEEMVQREWQFYECLRSKTPPISRM